MTQLTLDLDEVPIAELERFGVSIRIINQLEGLCGLWLGAVVDRSRDELIEGIPGFGKVSADQVVDAIRDLLRQGELQFEGASDA